MSPTVYTNCWEDDSANQAKTSPNILVWALTKIVVYFWYYARYILKYTNVI